MAKPPKAYLLAGLVEQESCISLTHSKCWNPKSRLKTPREEGAGFGQITRAYNSTGSIRFDEVSDLKLRYPELRELTWANIYDRPDLQLKALVLMNKTGYEYFLPYSKDSLAALAFNDAGYNGGKAGVDKERRACKLALKCDPSQWFDHVELYCMKSKAPLYGTRSACDINREHVKNVMLIRSEKYKIYFKE